MSVVSRIQKGFQAATFVTAGTYINISQEHCSLSPLPPPIWQPMFAFLKRLLSTTGLGQVILGPRIRILDKVRLPIYQVRVTNSHTKENWQKTILYQIVWDDRCFALLQNPSHKLLTDRQGPGGLMVIKTIKDSGCEAAFLRHISCLWVQLDWYSDNHSILWHLKLSTISTSSLSTLSSPCVEQLKLGWETSWVCPRGSGWHLDKNNPNGRGHRAAKDPRFNARCYAQVLTHCGHACITPLIRARMFDSRDQSCCPSLHYFGFCNIHTVGWVLDWTQYSECDLTKPVVWQLINMSFSTYLT